MLREIEAINVGQRPVKVSALAQENPAGRRLFPAMAQAMPGLAKTDLPVSLSDGQSAHVSISYSDAAAALIQSGNSGKIKLTPVCLDSAGGVYKGEPWDVDPNEFLKM
jgi:hypothetical protein